MSQKIIPKTILVVGDSGVGKTSLTLRLSEDTFSEASFITLGSDCVYHEYEFDSVIVKLKILDTAGQERFRTITSSYYRGAAGIILVFNVNDLESFLNVKVWYQEVLRYAPESARVFILGNKADLEHTVEHEKIHDFADNIPAPFEFVSAKTGLNVDDAFRSVAKSFYEKEKDNISKEATLTPNEKKKTTFFGNLKDLAKKSSPKPAAPQPKPEQKYSPKKLPNTEKAKIEAEPKLDHSACQRTERHLREELQYLKDQLDHSKKELEQKELEWEREKEVLMIELNYKRKEVVKLKKDLKGYQDKAN